MRVTILGKCWDLKFVSKKEMKDRGMSRAWGYCDPPDAARKEIVILDSLKPETELEVLAHEVAHAADWSKDEQWIEDFAIDLARILTRLGYSRAKKD